MTAKFVIAIVLFVLVIVVSIGLILLDNRINKEDGLD